MFESKLSIFFAFTLFLSCGTTKEQAKTTETPPPMETHNKTPDPKGITEGSQIISSEVVWKKRVIKGEVQEEGDYYLVRSVQDYFIKFCEGEVTKEQLEEYMKKQKGMIQVLKAEVQFLDGEWDSCEEGEISASRTGPYVVLRRLIE